MVDCLIICYEYFHLCNHLVWSSASYGSLTLGFWEMRQFPMPQRQLQLCYSSIFSLTNLWKFVYLTCLISIFLHHHVGILQVKEKSFPFLLRSPSLVLCFIPPAGTNGLVNEDRKCRDQKPGFTFLSCYFSCFHSHIFVRLSPFYG